MRTFKQQMIKLIGRVSYLQAVDYAKKLTDEERVELETAEKQLAALEKNPRLEYLRKELRAGKLSYLELCELQSLAPYIEPGDVELLEWAGVPEFEEEPEETYCIEYLNAAKRHARDRAEFKTYNEAVIWGRANFENFNTDMIRINQ
jgi:hypothetical protein